MVFENIINVMGYLYNIVMTFIIPFQAPLSEYLTYTQTFYNPFFKTEYTNLSLGNIPIISDILEFQTDIISKFFELFGFSSDVQMWVVVLFIVAVCGVAILIWRSITNFIN